jgi:hypothetical protein
MVNAKKAMTTTPGKYWKRRNPSWNQVVVVVVEVVEASLPKAWYTRVQAADNEMKAHPNAKWQPTIDPRQRNQGSSQSNQGKHCTGGIIACAREADAPKQRTQPNEVK